MTTNAKKTKKAISSKKRILNSAIKVFAEKGPHASTIDEIAECAGYNKRLIYHYFGNKNGLYKASLEQIYQDFLNLEVNLSSMLLPPDKLIEMLVRLYYTFLDSNPDFVSIISFENLNRGQAIKELDLNMQKAPVVHALELALEKGQAENGFQQDIEAVDLLLNIFSLCFFFFSNKYTMGHLLGDECLSHISLERRVKSVVTLILHGISVGKKPQSSVKKSTLQPA